MKISYKETLGWLFIIVSLVMLANSIRLCFSIDIWYDELFTMGMIEHSYGELVRFTAKDVHPPLYYCIVKFIVDLCKLVVPSANAVIITKMVSVLPYFLLVVYALTFLRTRFGIFPAGLFSFCMLSMPQMSAYTVEMRMYGFALLFVTAAFFHAYAILFDSGDEAGGSGGDKIKYRYAAKYYAALAFYGLAAAYTQYFACVAVIMVYLYLFVCLCCRYWKKRQGAAKLLKGWFLCVLVSVIGYVPWLFALFVQITAVRANYWILPLTWRSLGGCVKFLMKPAFTGEGINVTLAVVLFLLYIAFIIAYAYREYRTYRDYRGEVGICEDAASERRIGKFFYALAGCLVLCGLVAFGFLASILVRPIFVYRYMLPAMGCFWICFVLSFDAVTTPVYSSGSQISQESMPDNRTAHIHVSRNQIRTLVLTLSALLLLAVGIRDYRAFMGEEEYKIVLMKETQLALSAIAKEDIILYNFDQLQAVEGYYRDQETYLWKGEPEELIIEMFGNKASVESTGQIKEWLRAGKKVWFLGSFNSREDICREWEADGLYTEEIGSYLLERYWFNIYSVSE